MSLFAAALLVAAAAADPAASSFHLEGEIAQGRLVRGLAPPGTVSVSVDGEPIALGEGGRFLFGLDRDQEPSAVLVARLGDGRTLYQRLRVAPTNWPTEHVGVARRPSGPSDAFLRMRRGELERIGAARARDTGSQGWRQTFIWPARGRISGRFGAQRVYRGEPGAYHGGIDIAAGAGAAVVAPADGVVVLAPPPDFSLEGKLVILDHGMGLNSAFLHLSAVSVREGDRVRQGQAIGTVGATGRATGPHLHWGLMWKGARIDPAPAAGPLN